jgi:hypothetical protein
MSNDHDHDHDHDPYVIMGLPRGASLLEIRARYKELARKHHPDKWATHSEEELRFHENVFKNITVAYHILTDAPPCSGSGANTSASENVFNQKTPEEWAKVWERMEILMKQKDIMKHLTNLFKATIHEVTRPGQGNDSPSPARDPDPDIDPGRDEPEETPTHHFTVKVTLEDIHAGKTKKVRLFLRDHLEPVFVHIPCDAFPLFSTNVVTSSGGLSIEISIEALPHKDYEWGQILDGEFDLFKCIHLDLNDYFTGRTVSWTHLDGSLLEVVIPAMGSNSSSSSPNLASRAVFKKFEGKGLMNKGSLFVSLEWSLPGDSWWNSLSDAERNCILTCLLKLRDHSGVEKPKSI